MNLEKFINEYKATKKKIPENIQQAIDEYKTIHCITPPSEPDKVHINSYKDFDCIKHQDCIIIFPPGGKVGDDDWKLQYFHNMNVICDYQDKLKRFNEPCHAPETFVIIEEPSNVDNISLYLDDILINKIDCMEYIYIYNLSFDLTPPIKKDNLFFISFGVDLDVVSNAGNMKTIIKYKDGKEEPLITHVCRY